MRRQGAKLGLRVLPVAALLAMGAALGVHPATAGAAGVLPPSNPPADLTLPSTFDTTGPCHSVTGGYTCQNPCFDGVVADLQTAFTTLQESTDCLGAAISAVNSARAAEGVGAMGLPSNWYSLSVPEQILVVTNLERVGRGEPALLGLVPSLDQVAQAGANAGGDPALSNNYGGFSSAASGSIWAGGQMNPLLADYDWMYDDGYRASGENLDCTSPSSSGCWGHRDIILGAYTGTSCANCVMGAGYATTTADGGHLSYAAVIARPAGAVPALAFSWAQEQPYLSASGAPSAVAAGASPALTGLSGGGLAVAPSPDGQGYSIASPSGGASSFGDAPVVPGRAGMLGTVGAAPTPDRQGWWFVTTGGAVGTIGDAANYGSLAGRALAQPIVGMASTPDGGGYWLVARDGGIFSFGDARFFGSTGAERLNQPIVGMASTPDGGGYWLVASDGGIFSFGDARFFGSAGAERLVQPIVGMASSSDGAGYWLVASDGGIFSFGDAPFFGSTGAERLVQPIVGMAPASGGYWLVARDGGIFTFGGARFFGSAA
jgi:hypothetical protein